MAAVNIQYHVITAMNIQYHVITAAAHIESLGEMRREHDLTNSAFIQLYVNELADMLHMFNSECKHGGNKNNSYLCGTTK